MPDFVMKANDTLPWIEATLGYEQGGVPDLTQTGTVLSFIMRRFTADGALAADVAVNAPAEILDAATGRVRYRWKRSDTAVPGTYRAEWEVDYGDGLRQTFPLRSYHEVDILADLDSD